MSNGKKVVISIAADGHTTIDAQGFKGNTCSLATKELEMVLTGGGGVSDDRKKPDFFQTMPGATQTNSA